jgi:hypothetical protein
MRGSRRRAGWATVGIGVALALVLALVLALASSGGSGSSSPHPSTSSRPTSSTPTSSSPQVTAPPGLAEVLSVPAVGRFYGRCALSEHQWTLQFVADPVANDVVVYRIGGDHARRAQVPPRGVLTWHLKPGAFRSRQPSDPLTRSPAATVRTTMPLSLEISQGTEPHTFRVDAQIALAAAIGDTTNCALVSSRLTALTYFNGGP